MPTTVGVGDGFRGVKAGENGGPEIIHVELRYCEQIYKYNTITMHTVDFCSLHSNEGAQQISMGTSPLVVRLVNDGVKLAFG